MHLTAGISEIGYSVPDRIVPNSHFETYLDTTEAWILDKTQIRERRWVGEDEFASDLGVAAIQDGCERAGILPQDLDAIIVGTWTADYLNPPTSSVIVSKLGFPIKSIDIHSGGCAGGVAALEMGLKVVDDKTQNVAVVLTEANSRMLNLSDRSTAVFLGDGAACYIIQQTETPRMHVLGSHLATIPDTLSLAWVPGGGRRLPQGASDRPEDYLFQMDGKKIWQELHALLPSFVSELLEIAKVKVSEITDFIPHQANGRMIDSLSASIFKDPPRVHKSVDRFGNTAGASVPLTFALALDSGCFDPCDKILLLSFGSGLTVGGAIVEYAG